MLCIENNIWYSWLYKDFGKPPFWFEIIVKTQLNRTQRKISDNEVVASIHWFKSQSHKHPSKNDIASIFNNKDLFAKGRRKHIVSLYELT